MPIVPNAIESTWNPTPVHIIYTNSEGARIIRRACGECKRKKARCGMENPQCALCMRVGSICIYPTRRLSSKRKSMRLTSRPNSHTIVEDDSHSNRGAANHPLPPSEELESFEQELPNINNMTDMIDFDVDLNSHTIPVVSASPLAQSNARLSPPYSLESDWTFFDDQADLFPNTHYGMQSLWSPKESLAGSDDFPSNNFMAIVDEISARRSHCSTETAVFSPITNMLAPPAIKQKMSGFGVEIARVADELIHLYFRNIQPFLPLFRKPEFYAQFVNTPGPPEQRYSNLSLVSEFLLNAMFGLSARFSAAPYFGAVTPLHRGTPFINQARVLWAEICKSGEKTTSTLACLQGLILLTFDSLQAGPSHQAWMLCGACSHLAYDLDLQNTDLDIISGEVNQSNLSVSEWSLREGKRRSWWMVWEMDSFASTVSRRPSTVDIHRMHVLLPVSDQAWFSQEIVFSVPLDAASNMPWRGLCDVPNQHERNWFLACTCILRQVCEAALIVNGREQAFEDVEAVIGSFVLALPEKFQMRPGSILFDKNHFAESNWIVCTLVLLQCFRGQILHSLAELEDKKLSVHHPELLLREPVRRSLQPRQNRYEMFYSVTSEMAHAARSWSQEYLPMCSPFIMCALVGPASMHIQGYQEWCPDKRGNLASETLRLVLRCVARYWMIGQVLIDILEAHGKLGNSITSQPQHSKEEFLPQWRFLVDDSS